MRAKGWTEELACFPPMQTTSTLQARHAVWAYSDGMKGLLRGSDLFGGDCSRRPAPESPQGTHVPKHALPRAMLPARAKRHLLRQPQAAGVGAIEARDLCSCSLEPSALARLGLLPAEGAGLPARCSAGI